MNRDYVIEVKVRDSKSNQLLDEGKICNRKGWDWLNKKYGVGTYASAWLELTFDDLDVIWDKNPKELIKYVEHKLKQTKK